MNKILRKITAITVAIVLVALLLPVCAVAADITIIHTNDRHGRVTTDPYIARLLADTGGNVLLLDAGDAINGQFTTNQSRGQAMIELMNAVGYSAMALGDREFSYGIKRLTELSPMAQFPMLAANVKNENGKNLFQAHEIFKMDGLTVGVFGLSTPETIALSDPRLVAGLIFDDPVKTAEREVATLKAAGCDTIIALTHLG